jgi:hypothetical protein
MASLALGAVGTAIGAPVGLGALGGFIGSAIGSAIDSALFAPSPSANKVEGPRLSGTSVIQANPGSVIPEIYGVFRTSPTVLASSKIIETVTTTTSSQSGGGKGGGQSVKTTTTEYSYHVDIDFLLSKGPILGIGRIWADGNLIRGPRDELPTIESNDPPKLGGFQYPDRFFENSYDPKLIPPSLSSQNANASVERYVMNAQRDGFEEIALQDIDSALEQRKVVYWRDTSTGYYIPIEASHAYVQNRRARNVHREWDDYYNIYDAINDFSPSGIFVMGGVDRIELYHGTDDQSPSSFMADVLGEPDIPAYYGRAHIVFGRLELEKFGNRVPNFRIEVVQKDSVTVEEVIVDLMDAAGVDPSLYDVSGVANSNRLSYVMGYGVLNQSDYRGSLESFLSAFDIDAVEFGSKIRFTEKQGKTFAATIDYTELGADDSTASAKIAITSTYRDPSELPDKITIAYSDPLRDYNNNSAFYRRDNAGGTSNIASSNYSMVMFPYYATDLAALKLQNIWMEATSYKFSIPRKYIFLKTGSAVLVKLPSGREVPMKIQNLVSGANGVIEVTAIAYLRNNNDYSAGFGGSDFTNTGFSQTVNVGFPDVTHHFLDTPPLTNTLLESVTYSVAGAPYLRQGLVDTQVLRSPDGVSYQQVNTLETIAVLGEFVGGNLLPANPCTYDRKSVIDVELLNSNDALFSVTVDALFGGANACMVGTEVLQYKDVQFLGGTTFRLTGLLRGLRGTDKSSDMDQHVVGERFILLNVNTIATTPVSPDFFGTPYFYKFVGPGQTEEITSAENITIQGRFLRPLAPCNVTGVRDGSNNLTITWTRRDRVYHYWLDGVDTPNSETEERYVVELYSSDFLTKLSSYDTTNPNLTVSASAQSSLGLTPGDKINVKVYQKSAIVNLGEPAEAIV